MFAIMLVDDARKDLALLPARLRSAMLDNIEAHLRHDPLRASRNRKPLRAPFAPRWELRVGEHRVFYRVDGRAVEVLRIVRKGRKKTEDVT